MRRFRILFLICGVVLSFILAVSAIELSREESYYQEIGAEWVILAGYDEGGRFLSCDLQHIDALHTGDVSFDGAIEYKEFIVTSDWQPIHVCTFGEAKYDWDFDEETCTASVVCTSCGNEVTETVDYVIESNTPAVSCSQPGGIVYTAQFENSLFEDQHYERALTIKHKRSYTVISEWQVEVRCSECDALLDTLSFPDYEGFTYKDFNKLTNLQKIAIENEMGETIYNRWVLYLKERQDAIEFGGEV